MNDIIGRSREDEDQEFQLGRLLWLEHHPGHPDAELKGYRRLKAHRRREVLWKNFHRRLIEEVVATDSDFDYVVLLVREILAMLPRVIRQDALRALASKDGRVLKLVGRKIREAKPDWIAEKIREWNKNKEESCTCIPSISKR